MKSDHGHEEPQSGVFSTLDVGVRYEAKMGERRPSQGRRVLLQRGGDGTGD